MTASNNREEETDIVVIGSGVGGLSCGALLARYGFKVIVCESHSIPGGAAHAFERNGFKFGFWTISLFWSILQSLHQPPPTSARCHW